MTNQMPPIPTFLVRGHADCVVSSDRTNFEAIIYGQADMPQAQNKLTAAFKGRESSHSEGIRTGTESSSAIRAALVREASGIFPPRG